MTQLFYQAFNWSFSSLKEILEVLMIPLAAVLLGAWVAHRWQNRQRDSAIRAELIVEISRLVMTTLMTLQLIKTFQHTAEKNSQHELDATYRKWVVETCVINSKIHAYFPNPDMGDKQIHRRWHLFSDRVSKYFEDHMPDGNTTDIAAENSEKDHILNEKARIIGLILTTKITGFKRKYQII